MRRAIHCGGLIILSALLIGILPGGKLTTPAALIVTVVSLSFGLLGRYRGWPAVWYDTVARSCQIHRVAGTGALARAGAAATRARRSFMLSAATTVSAIKGDIAASALSAMIGAVAAAQGSVAARLGGVSLPTPAHARG